MKKLLIAITLITGFVCIASAEGIEPNVEFTSEAKEKIEYPADAIDQQIEGNVKVYFELENGKIVHYSVRNTDDEKLRLEAVEFLKSLSQKELMGLCPSGEGKFILPINFKIV